MVSSGARRAFAECSLPLIHAYPSPSHAQPFLLDVHTFPYRSARGQVTVYYDPDATVLRGRPETWVRGCWNRWAHAQCFLPELMRPVLPGGIGFHRATVQARALQCLGSWHRS